MNAYRKLALTLGILLGMLLFLILYLSWPLLTGTEAVLDTRPVDPFDPFRGQYMDINYEIGLIPAIEGATIGDTVYVAIAPDAEGVARYVSASHSRPEGLFLTGKIESDNRDTMRVRFGIEQFFFEHNAEVPTENVTVRVKIASDGRARVVELLQNGKPAVIEYEPASLMS